MCRKFHGLEDAVERLHNCEDMTMEDGLFHYEIVYDKNKDYVISGMFLPSKEYNVNSDDNNLVHVYGIVKSAGSITLDGIKKDIEDELIKWIVKYGNEGKIII